MIHYRTMKAFDIIHGKQSNKNKCKIILLFFKIKKIEVLNIQNEYIFSSTSKHYLNLNLN